MHQSHFFAMLSRMKHINRWGLMRNTYPENISEHSLQVAMIAHALAVLRNRRFGGSVSPERVALLSLFHDTPEILTGDLPTPVKYRNTAIRSAYQQVELDSAQQLLQLLPDDLQGDYRSLFLPEKEEKELWVLVKAADKISALIKCIEEQKAGNQEFRTAAVSTRQSIVDMHIPEADVFLEQFLPSFSLTLDELNCDA
ncbi:5'-deoxynucleotidase [Solibaculum mannosilyticum]|uniref:5'-deoxynucleotidase n=1 Tax=Solibaculum mannosilyticum TaxID=2780922 RepID=A0A7I8D3T1_9FIRM|nr:5'-deoxynucleotidase [Solibaculum mannosilyticum]BCI61466.1 5'-deoxynucleotidase [Solibaculum mannosilyticum]